MTTFLINLHVRIIGKPILQSSPQQECKGYIDIVSLFPFEIQRSKVVTLSISLQKRCKIVVSLLQERVNQRKTVKKAGKIVERIKKEVILCTLPPFPILSGMIPIFQSSFPHFYSNRTYPLSMHAFCSMGIYFIHLYFPYHLPL